MNGVFVHLGIEDIIWLGVLALLIVAGAGMLIENMVDTFKDCLRRRKVFRKEEGEKDGE